jgi:selenide,water dikinase
MVDGKLSAKVYAENVPVIKEALAYADEFLLTAAAQKNRNHFGGHVRFENVPFAMEEVLFDPQTSGGLLVAVAPECAEELLEELQAAGLPAQIVGELVGKDEYEIYVR